MECTEARKRISIRLDGEPLGAAEQDALEAHLAGCAGCRRDLEAGERHSRALAAALAPASPDGDLARRILRDAALRPPVRTAPAVLRLRNLVALAAAVLLALGLWHVATPPLPEGSGEGPSRIEAPISYMIEHERIDSDVVPAQDGAPLHRQTSIFERMYRFPVGGARSGRITIQQTDTGYYHMASWPYQ